MYKKGQSNYFMAFLPILTSIPMKQEKKTLLFRLEKREDHYKITQENPEHKHAVRKLNSRPFSATQENYMTQPQQEKNGNRNGKTIKSQMKKAKLCNHDKIGNKFQFNMFGHYLTRANKGEETALELFGNVRFAYENCFLWLFRLS